jgi:hypothetical protein
VLNFKGRLLKINKQLRRPIFLFFFPYNIVTLNQDIQIKQAPQIKQEEIWQTTRPEEVSACLLTATVIKKEEVEDGSTKMALLEQYQPTAIANNATKQEEDIDSHRFFLVSKQKGNFVFWPN